MKRCKVVTSGGRWELPSHLRIPILKQECLEYGPRPRKMQSIRAGICKRICLSLKRSKRHACTRVCAPSCMRLHTSASWMTAVDRGHRFIHAPFYGGFVIKSDQLLCMHAKQRRNARRDMVKMPCVCHEIVSY